MHNSNTVRYSEIFFSSQGEAHYTGIPSLWLRFFICNLECRGFGQADPTDPETYIPVGNDFPLEDITDLSELPVFSVGCDSAYSVSKRYKHLMGEDTPADLVDKLAELLPGGHFCHPATKQWAHMVFTGGEPMLPGSQRGMVAILKEFEARGNLPRNVTIETNGTKLVTPELTEYVIDYQSAHGGEWFWSISPKLWTTSGEPRFRAIKPEVIKNYSDLSHTGQLKYVVNGSDRTWKEVEEVTAMFRDVGCEYPVWIMPEGGTEEVQRGKVSGRMSAGDIANEALQRGYNVAARVHNYLWGNTIGV